MIKNLGHRLGNMNDLPEKLRSQIPEFNIGGLDERCYKVLKDDLEGVASLSEIIVFHYKRFGDTGDDRKSFMEAIYRLIRKKIVKRIDKMKSVYCLTEVQDD